MLTYPSLLFNYSRRWLQRGFSLIELALVMLIIAILVSLAFLMFNSVQNSMRANRSKQVLAQIGSSINSTFGSSASATPYSGLSLQGVSAMSFIPTDLITNAGSSSAKLYLPIGNSRTVEVTVSASAAAGGSSAGAYFTIKVAPYLSYCQDLATTHFGSNALRDTSNATLLGASATVGTVDGISITGNVDNSAMSNDALTTCKSSGDSSSNALVWNHV